VVGLIGIALAIACLLWLLRKLFSGG